MFGYFGQINPFKGIDLILSAVDMIRRTEAAARIKVRVHGNVIGVSDEFRRQFETAAEQPDGLLEYRGAYQNEDVQELMSDCDFVLMASKWWENSPVVIQEAYSVERPVLAPAIGGMAEKVLDGQTGHHFKPGDARSLAALMLELATAGLAAASKYRFPQPQTAQDMAGKYMTVLDAGSAGSGRKRGRK